MTSGMDYPDLSKPLFADSDYPDLSKPLANQQQAAPDQQPQGFWAGLNEKYQNFMNPNKVDKFGHPMVETFLGRMPDINYPENKEYYKPKVPTQEDMNKAAGVMTMMLAPEIKIGAMLPSAIRAMLPELSGGARVAADYLSSIGKTGAGGYVGAKMMGADNPHAAMAGGIGAGTTAAMTPLMMATSSLNPLVRLAAGTGLGSMLGYGVGQMTGGSPYTTAGGGIVGGLLGLRGSGAGQLAAQTAAQSLTPEQIATAQARQAAGQQVGVPLTLAESTGSPVLGAMQQEAAMSAPGSKVLYPFGLQRQQQEEQAYQRLLEQISPKDAVTKIESPAFRAAFDNAEKQGTKVDLKPVLDYINNKLPTYESGSKIAQALVQAKDRLSLTPQTAAKYQQQMAPLNQIEQNVQGTTQQLRQQIQQMQANAPDPYFRASSGYDQQMQQLQSQLAQHESVLNQIQQQKQAFMQANNIGEYENTVEGLHNAKLGIRGILEGQGEKAIGKTAAGELKQVNKILNNQLQTASPEYAAASQISNLRQVRDNIENAMAKSNLTGSNFYDKVLANRNEYEDLYARLADPQNPKKVTLPQRNLAAMREAFPDLMDNLTAKSGKALAEKGAELNVNLGGLAKSFLNKIYMDRYNKAVADLMINPQWEKELQAIAKMKAGEDRGIRLGRLISKVATTGGVGAYQANQQGSQPYGTGQ